jgi:mannitol/fructose-specific phosphotransferase system IIA component (Ntr-type)
VRSILTALQEGRLFELPDTGGKPRALGFLARILDANPDIEVGTDIIEEINHREEECNTGIGQGIAVPHVRARREEGELFCAIGWSSQGIDYGAADGKPVNLVVMYYIPGAQKNVYLKEISSLVKAIRKTGGIDPIAHATDLNDVRNLLLDWVGAASGDSGPEAVARMIKLEIKQAQAPVPPAGAESVTGPGKHVTQVTAFSVLVVPPQHCFVLAPDADWTAALEADPGLVKSLATAGTITVKSQQLFVTGTTSFPRGRVLYQCVAVTGGAQIAAT